MKYLILFEAHIVKDLINWNMIKDVRDMALEYLDEGLKLNIIITQEYDTPKPDYRGRIKLIYIERYSHEHHYKTSYFENYNKNYKLKIEIYLTDKYLFFYKEKSAELIERIKEAYPNEIIDHI